MLKDIGDHAVARQLQSEIARLRGGAEALANVAGNRSPLDTEGAHALKVGKMARKFDSEVTVSMNRAIDFMRSGTQDVQRRIQEKVNLTPDAFAAEIRAAFRTLDAKGKANLINALVKENRGPELAAIVKAPSVLTGISDQQRASYEQMIVATHAAEEMDELAKLTDVFDTTLAAQNTAGNFARNLTDPHNLAAIERGAAASEAAGTAFDQSLNEGA
jgi:hypothetical protein